MKRKHLLLVGVMCYAQYFSLRAQLSPPIQKLILPKAQLFNKLPEQIDVSKLFLYKLFAGPDSGFVRFPLSGNNFFEGTIREKVRVNPHVVNINIKSSNYSGAMLSISKISYDDLSVKYIGRIVSINYGDVFLLTQENGALFFRKKQQSTVITE